MEIIELLTPHRIAAVDRVVAVTEMDGDELARRGGLLRLPLRLPGIHIRHVESLQEI